MSLAVLIETMRREGFELSVSPPAVLFRTNAAGEKEEPYEHVVVDVDEEFSGSVIERMAARKGSIIEFAALGKSGKVRMSFRAPSRGLIGFQSELKTESRGTATVGTEQVVWCGVVWYGVVWCRLWCGVVPVVVWWCFVVWCGLWLCCVVNLTSVILDILLCRSIACSTPTVSLSEGLTASPVPPWYPWLLGRSLRTRWTPCKPADGCSSRLGSRRTSDTSSASAPATLCTTWTSTR